MTFDPNRIYAELIEAGNAWCDAEEQAQDLEEMRKSLLAQIKLRFEGSDANRETHALASQEYVTHIKGMVVARGLANKARVRYANVQVLAEMRRTQESTRRQEMRLT